jgi:hypothetical protein
VTPFVRSDDVQPRGEAEPNAANERIREPHSHEIDMRVFPKERSHRVL